MLNKAVFALVAALTMAGTTAQAATVTMDISDKAGFTFSGASGSSGNGVLSVSPKYFFDPDTTIDFGIATIIGDEVDHRSGCGLPGQSFCLASTGTVQAYFLTNGQGGFPPALFNISGLCSPVAGTDFCAPTVTHLLFTLGPNNDGIQLAFQGRSLSIVPVPLPAALPMFAAGLGLLWFARRRTRRAAAAASRASVGLR